jgi:hypothetical protein
MFYGIPKEREAEFFKALGTIAEIYKGNIFAADMMICLWKNLSFQHDRKFLSSFTSSVTDEQERSLFWRVHTLAWAAKTALLVEGDFVECGVLRGFCSNVIFKYLDFGTLPRQAYLYDTFSGLPPETSTEAERTGWDYSAFDPEKLYGEVRERFSAFGNVNVIRGIVPDSFAIASPQRVAFLHVDMNSEKAEMLALEHLFNKVVPGGVIVLDDFGWMCNVNQMKSELAFFTALGHQVLELPTGQGLVIRHA